LKRIFLIAAIALLITLPVALIVPVNAQPQRKALILSSLESLAPMGLYRTLITDNLQSAGYTVTFLSDTAVTLDVLQNQLDNYNVILWRTNTYTFDHLTYWYVGQRDNAATEQTYASDVANGYVNVNAGVLGVTSDFFSNHLSSGSLRNVTLVVLVSSDSDVLAPIFVNAGSQSVIVCNADITLTFGTIDDLTASLFSYLATGQDVYDAVYHTVSPYVTITLNDELDNNYTPPFAFFGDSTVTLT
jgi:hypothetical protein